MVWFVPVDFTVPPSLPDDVATGIVGKVIFPTHRGEPAEAILDESGRWNCPRLPVLNRVLNILHAPRRGDGHSTSFGDDELHRVAGWLKGRAVIGMRPGNADRPDRHEPGQGDSVSR